MDAGNAVTPLCFPNFQNEVLALADASAVDASAVDSSAVPTLLRFPRAGRETSGDSPPSLDSDEHSIFLMLSIQLIADLVEMCLLDLKSVLTFPSGHCMQLN